MILAFQTGKGSTDNLLKEFTERVSNSKFCEFDQEKYQREYPSPSGVLKILLLHEQNYIGLI
jgi:hypothetical protein